MVKAKLDKTVGSRASGTQKRTRIQREKEAQILDAALEVFSIHGFRGATLDQIAESAGLSKPNLLYYFPTKEAIHRTLLDNLLHLWLEPLEALDPEGEPVAEILAYIDRKLELAREYPRESRLFANEILQGAPRIKEMLEDLKILVDKKAVIINRWMDNKKLARTDPYHLLFSIWATTQHYADFDAQVRTVMPEKNSREHFSRASRYLRQLYTGGLTYNSQ